MIIFSLQLDVRKKFKQMNAKWLANRIWIVFFVLSSVTHLRTFGQELTLYVIPSPTEMVWDSPSSLMTSTLRNHLKSLTGPSDYDLGHIFVELSHEKRGEKLLTGMTRSKPNTASSKIFRQGYGLGILFADLPGRLQRTKEVKASIEPLMESGNLSFITFQLSEANYDRLLQYYAEYKSRGFGSIYNGLNKPREGLGAGCAEFSMSFLDVAGIDHNNWRRAWEIRVKVPEKLVGGVGINSRHVSILQLLLVNRWAKETEPHLVFEVVEPFYMHRWISQMHAQLPDEHRENLRAAKKLNSIGLIVDHSEKSPPGEAVILTQKTGNKIPD